MSNAEFLSEADLATIDELALKAERKGTLKDKPDIDRLEFRRRLREQIRSARMIQDMGRPSSTV